MKIPLNVGQDSDRLGGAAQDRALEGQVLAVKGGDWTMKETLVRQFMPLITSSAEKRTTDPDQQAQLTEAGKQGILKAAKRYKRGQGAHMFRIAVVEYIEDAMDRVEKGSFLGRLFGRGQ